MIESQHVPLAAEGHVKVLFGMEQDEDGWPPIQTESLWAGAPSSVQGTAQSG
ncbi:hypothetical protein [Streptodolium elevatio]